MDLVDYLRQEGRTLKGIGGLIGVSESFVSRVARGKRSFTIDHLAQFERALARPILELLLESFAVKDIAPEQRAAIDEALQILRKTAALRA